MIQFSFSKVQKLKAKSNEENNYQSIRSRRVISNWNIREPFTKHRNHKKRLSEMIIIVLNFPSSRKGMRVLCVWIAFVHAFPCVVMFDVFNSDSLEDRLTDALDVASRWTGLSPRDQHDGSPTWQLDSLDSTCLPCQCTKLSQFAAACHLSLPSARFLCEALPTWKHNL